TTLKVMASDAGIQEVKGQIEFYPPESHALRLPFGFVPGRPHDPKAWVRFVEDYLFGRIKRHSVRDFVKNLDEWRAAQFAKHRAKEPPATRPNESARPAAAVASASSLGFMGVPRRDRFAGELDLRRTQRYRAII